MRFVLLLPLLLSISLLANDFQIVVNEKFPLDELTQEQLKKIYLKKVTYIDGIKIFAINIAANNKLRDEFEAAMIAMSKKSLKSYWNKAHYHGVRPPKSLKSASSVLSYVANIEGAIAYVPKSLVLDGSLHVIKVKE